MAALVQQQLENPGTPRDVEPYVPKSMLITGGAGFIGSNVVIHMVNKFPNCKIVCVDKLDYCSSLRNLDPIIDKSNFKFVRGNITSHSFMSYLLRSEQIDTIIHYAASTHVDNSFGNSFTFTENNVMGTHVMLESAHEYNKVRRFIHVSTDEVYGETSRSTAHKGDSAVEDSTVLSPTNPYAASKAGAEFLVMSYFKSYHMPIIVTRGNNVYGPRQYPEKLIPKFTMLLMEGKKMTVHGSGLEKRNHLFVGDCVKAFERILVYGQVGEIYNIGTPREISNLEVAKKLAAIFGLTDKLEDHLTHVDNRLFNDFRYNLDLSKLTNLGWKAEVDFDDGLTRTVEWYKQYGQTNWSPQQIACALVAHPRLQGVCGADSTHSNVFT